MPNRSRSISRDRTPESSGEADEDHDEAASQDGSHAGSHTTGGDQQQPPRKRQRVRLSCLECRRRKLSCDRGFPCERCTKSGTPDRCSYESRNGEVVSAASGLPPPFTHLEGRRFGVGDAMAGNPFAREDHDRIRRLEMEIAQLKNQLPKSGAASSLDGSTVAGTNSPATQKGDATAGGGVEREARAEVQACTEASNLSNEKGELRFFRGKGFRTRYFGPHNASMAFVELTGLCPFMRETADEWLRPTLMYPRKDRKWSSAEHEYHFRQPDAELEALLPSKQEVDALVDVYLDHFEQVHRIVHIPTFRKEYTRFWEAPKGSSGDRYAAMTALILCMIAVSSCVHAHEALKFVGMMSTARHCAEKWINACDAWMAKQSQKHRRLIHFQIQCLLYMGKRVNTIKKKRFWTHAGALVQDGVAVGLHREPSYMGGKITPYNQEMRRRIWATVQEFDMQASFDYGLPTLISQLHYDVNAPRNLDDEEFDENTMTLPESKPATDYTFSSFQHLARQSLPLRLELSRLLTGPVSEVDYDQVIRYTNDLTHEIDCLPSWEMTGDNVAGKKIPLIAYTLLHVQLRQYITPLHQPYIKLRSQNSKYQYSEIIYFNAARDIVLLQDKLYQQGVRALNFVREDALTAAINLGSVTLLQPRGSTNMIMVNSQHTVKLIEKCLTMKEDKLLRSGNNEPWGYSVMCATMGLLEAHLGIKDTDVAKASSAERFIRLQYRLLENQEPPKPRGEMGPPDAGVQSMADGAVEDASPVAMAPALEEGPNAAGVPPSGGRPKAGPPMTFMPSMPSLSGEIMGAPQPWLGPSPQMYNFDASLELLGLNLNELWGESWELG